jgi:hypothetical protein
MHINHKYSLWLYSLRVFSVLKGCISADEKDRDSIFTTVTTIDILYTLDSASTVIILQFKNWSRDSQDIPMTQDIPMKWEDSYVFYFLNRELKH